MDEKRELQIALRVVKREIGYLEKCKPPIPIGSLDALRYTRDFLEKILKRM